MRVTVVGAGISGLTCAVRLQQAGHDVQVLAAEPPARTTSTVAAALWYPYRALPQERVTRWAAATLEALRALPPEAGVRMRTGTELLRAPAPDPWWRDAVPDLERVSEPAPGFAAGWRLTVPVLDPAVHLPWLLAQLPPVVPARLARLEDAPGDAVVNATGLGARPLLPDASLVPVRGQVVVVEQVGLDEWVLAQDDPARPVYVVPRETTVVLGGTADAGAEDLVPDPAVARRVVDRCAELVPAVRGARVVAHRVGLRPTRPAVRLETGRLRDGRTVVHDYGHGGAGITLSWGCAADVVGLLATAAGGRS